jgi:hypothetical protein
MAGPQCLSPEGGGGGGGGALLGLWIRTRRVLCCSRAGNQIANIPYAKVRFCNATSRIKPAHHHKSPHHQKSRAQPRQPRPRAGTSSEHSVLKGRPGTPPRRPRRAAAAPPQALLLRHPKIEAVRGSGHRNLALHNRTAYLIPINNTQRYSKVLLPGNSNKH